MRGAHSPSESLKLFNSRSQVADPLEGAKTKGEERWERVRIAILKSQIVLLKRQSEPLPVLRSAEPLATGRPRQRSSDDRQLHPERRVRQAINPLRSRKGVRERHLIEHVLLGQERPRWIVHAAA